MKRSLLTISLLLTLPTQAAEEHRDTIIALPLYGSFTQTPDAAALCQQAVRNPREFLSTRLISWNLLKLVIHLKEIVAMGKALEKVEPGSFNILHKIAKHVEEKKYGKLSKELQDKLACIIVRQPLIPDIRTLLSELHDKGIHLLGYANQDEKEYECFEKYLSENHGIDLHAVCAKGIVVCPYYQTREQFSEDQSFLQKGRLTIARKPFPDQSFLDALHHHSQGMRLVIATTPKLLEQPLDSEETIPFETVSDFKRHLQNDNVFLHSANQLRPS